MRAAIYARYSSDNQRDASIEDQIRICRGLIERSGWIPVQVYSDRAISGATVLRPAYQKLLADARTGAFDVVVAEALDRLSRDLADVANLYKQLQFLSIKLVTLAEGEISELHVGLKGTMNALYLKDLAQKTRRGLEGRVRQGRSGGGLCYGYDVVREVDGNGEAVRGKRRINEAEAEVVRQIFQDYANGRSPKAIALALNENGVPSPRARGWGPSTINGNRERGTGILNNELYSGRLVWNRLTYRKDPQSGKRISRINPESDWVVREVPELRILPDALWSAVKARQAGLKARKRPVGPEAGFWDRRRPRFLLSGLIKCGVCGGGYSKISANLFGCSTHRNKGTCSNDLNIRRDLLEATILSGLKTRLMAPELVKEFADTFIAEVNSLRKTAASHRDRLDAELVATKKRIRTVVTAITDGAPPKTLVEELRRLEEVQARLEQEISAEPHEPQPLIHPNMSEIYRRRVENLHNLLIDPASKDEASEIIRSLIDRIVLSPMNGELQIDLHGELAAILNLCQDSKKPAAEIRDGLEQIKLVAGARYHRDRHSLTVPI